MKNGALLLLVVAVAIVMSATFATAQESQVIHFQGILTGPDGNPLRTDIYNVIFSMWEHALNDPDPIWSEMQTVEVVDGLFDVFLGDVNPLSPDVFIDVDNDGTHLEIQVEGDNPMTPRTQIGKTADAFISSRVLGDIETGPYFLLIRDTEGDPAIALNSGGSEKGIIVICHRPDGSSSSIDMKTGAESRMTIINDMPSGDRAVEISAGENGASQSFLLTETHVPVMNFHGDISGARIQMSGYQSGQQIGPLLGMNTDALGANFAMTAPSFGGLRTDIENPIIEMIADDDFGSFSMYNPLQDPGLDPVVEIIADAVGSRMIINDGIPGGKASLTVQHISPVGGSNGAVEISANSGADLTLMYNTDLTPAVEMHAGENSRGVNVNWVPPPDDNMPAVELVSADYASAINANWSTPEDAHGLGVEISSSQPTGAMVNMYAPTMGTGPILQMNTLNSGATFEMTAPSYGGLRTDIETPIIAMATGLEMGASIVMFQPQPEPPGSDPILEMLVGSSGGNFTMYGQQARLQSTPFFEISSYSTGADLKFFDPAGGTTVEINSGGDVIAKRGSFGQNNTNNGTAGLVSGGNNAVYGSYSAIVAGYGNTIGTAADHSCLVGVDASLSADSTFMVDMPHIHFGDETDGYEFPTTDGRPNEMLATDGNGQLSWVDVTALANENTRQLIDENKELKNLITQLERRITELEKKTR